MNPWTRLPAAPPYVLDDDRSLIVEFNAHANEGQKICTDLFPEPFLGRPDAPVVLLGLNPGWSSGDAKWHQRANFAKLSRDNLEHAPSPFPFYLLNPALAPENEDSAPGNTWWHNKLKSPISDVGLNAVANGLLCVEYFPYHSDKYARKTPRVKSQEYGIELVRNAITRKAIIIVLRSLDRWLVAVPELSSYGRRYCLNSTQNVAISEKNCPTGYGDIIEVLKSSHRA